MVKIEKVSAGAKATFLRGDVDTPVYTGMLISISEMEALQITGGTITVSIDEGEIVVLEPTAVSSDSGTTGKTLELNPVSEVKTEDAPVTIKLNVEDTAKAPVTPAKVIVQPVRKK